MSNIILSLADKMDILKRMDDAQLNALNKAMLTASISVDELRLLCNDEFTPKQIGALAKAYASKTLTEEQVETLADPSIPAGRMSQMFTQFQKENEDALEQDDTLED